MGLRRAAREQQQQPSKMQAITQQRAFSSSARPAGRCRTVVVRASQSLQGKVVSTAMNKSVVVAVERLATHPEYQKRVRITKRYIAHDEGSGATVGDYVRLEGCRPLSKSKRFTVAEVIRKAD
ncbi:30S ribosomal protein S17 [Raphidocelis subcapitata]|uniref:Small ribosomal subunit protein uS17c n=1 Tax=Raphidocelis subcapitata TaxID=307507 RepID=A0A2V0P8H8_9CHLO|nr:30S ribosomal protein S17 [Raphidocelis subcapitata]|eukprot:GBF95869.1 30S ribosomal protein S17 [Raphidocelis subcapitata]